MSAPEGRELERLAALAEWLRGELDQSRAGAAARAVTERATGILMERLGCPADEARQQLDHLAAGAGITPEQFAADIAGEHLAALPPRQRRQVSRADAAAAQAPD